MSDADADTSRTVVQTYVPAYQRDVWDEHADALGMSRSEFVKTMVQAGRSVFDGREPETGQQESDRVQTTGAEKSLDEAVLGVLEDGEPRSWEDILAALTGDIESRLEETLQDLQAADEIRYSGPDGGYILEETDE